MKRASRIAATLRALNRAELAVIGFCALGAGNVWIRVGGGNVVTAPSPGAFILGFALVVAAAGLCYLASGRPAAMPGALVCTVAIAVQTLGQPVVLPPAAAMYLTGLALAAVPLLRSPRQAWLLLGACALAVTLTVTHAWTWGYAPIDVFDEVQGSTQAFLHGQNPYAPVYPILLDSYGAHQLYGSGSLNYGPMVIILSIPARLIGDVRLTVVALNVAILAAVVVWTRRAAGSHRHSATIAAVWLASPFLPFMILTEWTDTFCVAGMAWWLVLRDRHRNWAIAALTVGLACKPTMLAVMVPLAFWNGAVRSELLRAAVATVAIVAPFAIWTGVPQFVYDTVGIYGDLPGRHDAANLNGLLHVFGSAPIPATVLLVGVVLAVVLFTLRRCRDYGDLLVAGAGLLIVACIFAKQAFLNYYFSAAIALLFVAGAPGIVPRGGLAWPAPLRRVLGSRLPRVPGARHRPTAEARAAAD
ncbi:MAG: DUF2029 domain-containing protein [Candidatus Dormibacteraeota bacterium]|uniref:DUF2029 domain-containing protein n=1 Tax=Candidatus Aeolococcus gillhamiae TaxID=3127015 RepID=A0A2W5Z566_9BACT|nr:DUF2029 domain-containing protein [Candidatus Dormibacteraeota bacterium]PZR80393.1 MAG: hypothetical protein DLM65_08130 [Candidatus Dormibacter sp. RRmetagenome_bin12]